MDTKKHWEKPQLVVLTRGEPEETILTKGKTVSAPAGPAAKNGKCQATDPWYCTGDCNSMQGS